jgi:hypothetical protein
MYTHNSTNLNQTEVPIFTQDGHAAGGVTDGVFHKSVSGRRHFMRRPPGISFDVMVLDRAKAAGAHTVKVCDKDTKKKYYASLEDVYRFGVPLDFPGWGRHSISVLATG